MREELNGILARHTGQDIEVLQRDTEVAVWGRDEPGQRVSVIAGWGARARARSATWSSPPVATSRCSPSSWASRAMAEHRKDFVA